MSVLKREEDLDTRPYRSISEVSDLVGVKPHVLRYWETQFSVLRPRKNRAGNRMYRPEEVRTLLLIKDLLYAAVHDRGRSRAPNRRSSPRSRSIQPGGAQARRQEVKTELRRLAGQLRRNGHDSGVLIRSPAASSAPRPSARLDVQRATRRRAFPRPSIDSRRPSRSGRSAA